MSESFESKSRRADAWKELPKSMERLIDGPLLRQQVAGQRLGESILRMSEPLVRDFLEIQDLIEQRKLKAIEFDDYVGAIPVDAANSANLRSLAREMAVNMPPANTLAAVYKTTSAIPIALRESMSAIFSDNVRERQRTVALAAFNEIHYFSNAYAEDMYARSVVHQLMNGHAKEATMVNSLKMQDVMWNKILAHRRPRISHIAEWIEGAHGAFTSTFKEFQAYIATLQDTTDQSGADSDVFQEIQLMLKQGYSISNASSEMQALDRSMRYTIDANHGRDGVAEDETGRTLCAIHVGAEGHGLQFELDGRTGALLIPGTMVPLTILVRADNAMSFTKKVHTLVRDTLTDKHFEKRTPDIAQGVEDNAISQPEDTKTTETRYAGRMLRNVSGAQLIETVRKMNRSFLQSQGTSPDLLDQEAEPRLRQKGSHAIVYCAATNRIAPVPVHPAAIPIGTLRNILRLLHLTPEEVAAKL